MRTTPKILLYIFCFLILQGCGMFMVPPTGIEPRSTVGETTPTERDFTKLPSPQEKTVVAVYKFRDQTGQYKPAEPGVNSWSTAIPQGLTTILLKSLEDSGWFTPIERENIGDLLNERQIIRTTRKEYKAKTKLPPLLFAGIILEGGVISYDTNILTGGAGVRYFGIGSSTEYRQDRITVYLRAVSTKTGKILNTVYTSKTILSQSLNGNMYRYVDPQRLFEAEIGVSNNEPTQMAVTEAINKAVYLLILEGIQDKLWTTTDKDTSIATKLLDQYKQEIKESNEKVVGKGIWKKNRRRKFSLGLAYTFNNMRGDYKASPIRPGVKVGLKYLFSDYFNINFSMGYQQLGSKANFRSTFNNYDVDLEYLVLPYNRFTPYVFGGIGTIYDVNGSGIWKFKTQFGGGIEYLISQGVGLRTFATYNIGFDDDWDQMISGKRDDHFLQVGVGIQINFGRNFSN